jgi:toxoflavin biosynthesis protein ToxD
MAKQPIDVPDLIDVATENLEFTPRNGEGSAPVRLRSFSIGKYPVTNEQYAAFLDACQSVSSPAEWRGGRPPHDEEHHPVCGISASEAEAYCRWLSNLTERTFRLPQEAEWEFAAGGEERWEYPWGDQFDPSRCNSRDSGIGRTTRVDTFSAGASAAGCIDMAGNVAEYCADIFRSYDSPDASGGLDSDGALSRVVRGGSFASGPMQVRCAERHPAQLGDAWETGFRVCSQ